MCPRVTFSRAIPTRGHIPLTSEPTPASVQVFQNSTTEPAPSSPQRRICGAASPAVWAGECSGRPTWHGAGEYGAGFSIAVGVVSIYHGVINSKLILVERRRSIFAQRVVNDYRWAYSYTETWLQTRVLAAGVTPLGYPQPRPSQPHPHACIEDLQTLTNRARFPQHICICACYLPCCKAMKQS